MKCKNRERRVEKYYKLGGKLGGGVPLFLNYKLPNFLIHVPNWSIRAFFSW